LKNNNRLFLMCGAAFSGKTTLSKKLAEIINYSRISFDEINEKKGFLPGDDIPQIEWAKTSEEAILQLKNELKRNNNVIVDDTFCFKFLRDNFKSVADQYGYQTVIIFIDISEEEVRKRITENRIKKNRSDISDAVLESHLKVFEKPGSDEKVMTFNSEKDEINNWLNKFCSEYLNT
jgi:predicted kinase